MDLAGDGQEAVDMARKAPYSAIFMDIQMPVMDGLAATKAIREWETGHEGPSLPIIALTAHAMHGDKERCTDAGMNGYLSKPVSVQSLSRELQRFIERTRSDGMPAEARVEHGGGASPGH